MHLGAAQRLAVDDLVDRGLDDRRAAEVDAGLAAHHHDLVGQRRNVGAAGGAAAEHGGDLRDAGGRHPALAVEGVAEVVLVGEHPVLLRQVGAAAVDQVDHRQAVVLGDLLGPHVLLHRLGEERAALHRRVVGDDHARRAVDHADAGDDAGRRHLVVVEPPGGQRRQLEERRERIEQQVDALAHQHLAALVVAAPRATQAGPPPPGGRAGAAPGKRGEGGVGRGVVCGRAADGGGGGGAG